MTYFKMANVGIVTGHSWRTIVRKSGTSPRLWSRVRVTLIEGDGLRIHWLGPENAVIVMESASWDMGVTRS